MWCQTRNGTPLAVFRKRSKISVMISSDTEYSYKSDNCREDGELLCSDIELEDLAREVLSYGSAFQFVARGSSMQPFIQDGDELVLFAVPAGKVKPGDVLFARTGKNRLVVHRVIRVRERDGERCFQLQGDDCARADGFIPESNVMARVDSVRRGQRVLSSTKAGRRLFSWAQVLVVRWFGKRPALPKIAQKILKSLGMI